MSETSSVFKPHRGIKSIMNNKGSTVLENGELFIEGQGSSMGSGKAKIKIGDGSTIYSSLPYAIGDTSTDPINYTDSSSTISECLSNITSGAILNNIIASLRRAVYLLNSNYKSGISTIVAAVNAKAGSSLSSTASYSTISSTIQNMKIANSTVNYINEYVSTTLKNTSAKTVYGSYYDISDWLETIICVRPGGSGWGNYPAGGVYLDDVKCDDAWISSGAAFAISGRLDVTSNSTLRVRATCCHNGASSSNTFSQGIRAYIFYA